MYILKNPVLIVIDMQNGFLGEKSSHVVEGVVRLVAECRQRSIPVVFTRFYNREGSPFETLIGWRRLREDTETELAKELQNIPGAVIDKDFYSAFTSEFEQLLEENGWRTLILCGVATESCVMKTAVDAFERHLVPLVVADATASDAGDELHQAGLMILRRFIGKNQLVTTADLLRDYDDFVRYSETETIESQQADSSATKGALTTKRKYPSDTS